MVHHLLLALVLLTVAFASGVHYDAVSDQKWPYRTEDDLPVDHEEYLGEQVLLFGEVESINRTSHRATIEVNVDEGPFTVTVAGIEADIEPGGVVQVYGTIRRGHTITATQCLSVGPTVGSE